MVLNMLVIGAACLFSLFFILWLLHLYLKNAAVVDIGWGLGFVILCVIYMIQGSGLTLRNVTLLVMLSLWGLRIATFLIKRLSFEKHEDKRYQVFRQKWGQHIEWKFLAFFQFQGLLQIFIGLPIMIVCLNFNPGISFIEILGFIIFALGLVGETLADEQLYQFKNETKNKGQVCNEGLWSYSRHPNYFFECVIWFGLFVYGLGSPMGWLGIIAPIIMTHLIVNVSGVPMAEEQSLKSRGEAYKKYQETTPMLIPWPKRKL